MLATWIWLFSVGDSSEVITKNPSNYFSVTNIYFVTRENKDTYK